MMRRNHVWLAASLIAASGAAFAADEDSDLARIPQLAPEHAAPQATSSNRNFIENALTGALPRTGLLTPFPSPQPAQWQDRLFLDTRDEWTLGPGWTFAYSGRLNLSASDRVPFPEHRDIHNELREAFVSWQPSDGVFVDFGRINLKNGVALGGNPTDFFKTRAVVQSLTADPSVLREDRLGTLMLQGQFVGTGWSATAAYAPKLTGQSAIYTSNNLPSFDPMLDRTNATDRVLLKGSVTLAEGLSPELLYYHADHRDRIGVNLTMGLGKQTVVYAEWAGGVRASLIDDALRYAQATGTLPRGVPSVVPDDGHRRFQNDLTTGFTFAPDGTNASIDVEYRFHEAGFGAEDWTNWFGAAARRGNRPGVNATLWYLRSYAQDQQEPTSRHTAFLRLNWVDAFVPHLELTALASIGLRDGSGLAQATADYYGSRSWTVGALIGGTFGGRQTDFGSLPQSASALVRFIRYL